MAFCMDAIVWCSGCRSVWEFSKQCNYVNLYRNFRYIFYSAGHWLIVFECTLLPCWIEKKNFPFTWPTKWWDLHFIFERWGNRLCNLALSFFFIYLLTRFTCYYDNTFIVSCIMCFMFYSIQCDANPSYTHNRIDEFIVTKNLL